MLKNLILLFIALLFNACFAVEEVSPPPKWFLSLPKDNVFLYGNGSGKTLEESKKNAINDLASSIKLKVNSSTSILNIQNNQEQESKILQNIQVSIENIELQNITFTHTEYKNKQYYSQIKISKNLLLKTLEDKYQDLYTQLGSLNSKNCKSISIKDKNTFEDLLNQAKSLVQSIQALDFSSKLPSLKAYEDIFNQNSPLVLARLVFSDTDDKEAIKILSSEYAKFIQNVDEKNIQTIYNKITIEPQQNKIIASLQANINDCDNKVVFYIQLHSTEINKQKALERLKIQLYKKLKEYQGNNQGNIPKIF
ncbi:LPP20 family lipoprotein [Helicobacter cappadocius]|uniref:LPP20 family lipoprotein n=1 Tax=Helicobacter cappadocius TaxID=3063998 RepID=A0AA90PXP2_9HELI|nr:MULTISPECIES: LPP20 family lipoprotein [unclassified Helicobacter]MDO7252576.1 LPP20 family lipoprotein [Helicobacter sp. faydin-H75]MDP2538443.1 LPP20 family lipoprotein [Helicobacter sp. faydin-H76]